MLYALLIIIIAALALTVFRLLSQLRQWCDTLQATPADSNLRLTVSTRLPQALALCRAVNARLDAAQAQTLAAQEAGRQLQATMAAVSHDIRTPLAGAVGYIELLQETPDPAARSEYMAIIRRRLDDLSLLLDELFLYTRLAGEDVDVALPTQKTALYPPVCEALAALYPKLQAAGIEPQMHFEDEAATAAANPEALGRILRNLVLNAVQHGEGDLRISQSGTSLQFTNTVPDPAAIDPAHMFDRFWRADPARGTANGGAGLGLAIARQLAARMHADITAAISGSTLTITLTLHQ